MAIQDHESSSPSLQIATKIHQVPKTLDVSRLPSLVLTNLCPWEWMVGRVSFLFGMAQPVRRELLVSGWVHDSNRNEIFQLVESPTLSASYRLLHMRCWSAKLRGSLPALPGDIHGNLRKIGPCPNPQVMLNFEKWTRFMSFPKAKNGSYHPSILNINKSISWHLFFSRHLFFSTIYNKLFFNKKWIGLHSLKLTKTPLKNGWLGSYLHFGVVAYF